MVLDKNHGWRGSKLLECVRLNVLTHNWRPGFVTGRGIELTTWQNTIKYVNVPYRICFWYSVSAPFAIISGRGGWYIEYISRVFLRVMVKMTFPQQSSVNSQGKFEPLNLIYCEFSFSHNLWIHHSLLLQIRKHSGTHNNKHMRLITSTRQRELLYGNSFSAKKENEYHTSWFQRENSTWPIIWQWCSQCSHLQNMLKYHCHKR